MKPLIHVEGKVAVITGGSRGVGKAIAKAFVDHGAKVLIGARKPEGVAETVKELGADNVLGVPFHAGEVESCHKFVQAAIDKWGKVDVLVNNAATNPYYGPAINCEPWAWQKTLDVNLRGYFECARAVAKHLLERKAPGSIINISSIQALLGARDEALYAMTKAAVISLTKTLAVELGPNQIRVNSLCLGLVDTRFAAALVNDAPLLKQVESRMALKRIGKPEDLAGPALLLASDAAAWVTGSIFVVDGGESIGPSFSHE